MKGCNYMVHCRSCGKDCNALQFSKNKLFCMYTHLLISENPKNLGATITAPSWCPKKALAEKK